jgi:hypothetical protein
MKKLRLNYHSKLINLHKSQNAFEIELIPFSIRRKFTKTDYVFAAVFNLRFSWLKGYSYLAINICHFIYLSIDFHRPI